ncbi:MAG: acetate--CoA ligase family protein [Thermoplasmatales archaeon]|nr:acetate--CoA ligase family protein [Thermoplasmatales archaeon]
MEGFFNPGSVAVIGASNDVSKVGGMILRNLRDSGFKGGIYPVNPKGGAIQDMKAYASVADIPGDVDLAVIAIKAPFVEAELEKLGSIGVGRVIVITAGFREEGTEGREAEERLAAVAERHGMRVIGPNCFGVMNAHIGLNTTFSSLFPLPGNIALTSQSGAVGASMLDWSQASRVGLSKFASLGNKMDVGEADLFRFLADDPDTKVVGMYAESIGDGARFMDAVRNLGKPVVALKSGRTGAGSKAASSHTGAIAGADSVYNALFKKLNITRVYSMGSMFDALSVFSLCKPMERDGVAIVTNAGGLGVMAADACSIDPNVTMAELSQDTIEAIVRDVPTIASALNPIDIRGDAPPHAVARVMEIVAKDPSVGGIVVLSAPLDTADLNAVAGAVVETSKTVGVPVVLSFTGGKVSENASAIARDGGVPTFSDPDKAVAALGMLRAHARNLGRGSTPLEMPPVSGRAKALEVIARARGEGRLALAEDEGKEILSAYGIPVPAEGFAETPSEAVSVADRIGYPVVLKVQSADIQHKTDVGGVIVNIGDADGVERAFEDIMNRCRTAVPHAKIDGVSVQQMAKGQEVILSFVRDDQFGPVISFGLGGIYVEILGEISQALLPLDRESLDDLVMSTKAYRMLSGARGKEPADLSSLEDVILKVAKIAEENEEIYELEINPVMVGKRNEGSMAVDALLTLRWK